MPDLGLELAVIRFESSFCTCFDQLLELCVDSRKACTHDLLVSGVTKKGKTEHAVLIALRRQRCTEYADCHHCVGATATWAKQCWRVDTSVVH